MSSRHALASSWLWRLPGSSRCGNSAGRANAAKNSRETAGILSPQEKEDPLAPLLQQANDAIDKMDFAAALDPLQKYIAQRPDEPYPHFQLGYAYADLKRAEDAKTRIFARDRPRPEDGAGAS